MPVSGEQHERRVGSGTPPALLTEPNALVEFPALRLGFVAPSPCEVECLGYVVWQWQEGQQILDLVGRLVLGRRARQCLAVLDDTLRGELELALQDQTSAAVHPPVDEEVSPRVVSRGESVQKEQRLAGITIAAATQTRPAVPALRAGGRESEGYSSVDRSWSAPLLAGKRKERGLLVGELAKVATPVDDPGQVGAAYVEHDKHPTAPQRQPAGARGVHFGSSHDHQSPIRVKARGPV